MKYTDHLLLKENNPNEVEVVVTGALSGDFDRANPPMEIRQAAARELKLDLESVNMYFQYYYLNRRFPIRKLTASETSFARTLRNLQYADNHSILSYLAQYQIRPEDHLRDRFLLARTMAGLEDDDDYRLMIKWQDYLIVPYLDYGNADAPLLRPLSKMELFLIVSNVASGNSMIPGQTVEIKDQMNAVQKLIDAYALIPTQEEKLVPDQKYEDLSVDELIAMTRLLTDKDVVKTEKPVKKTKTPKSKEPAKKKTTKTKTTKSKKQSQEEKKDEIKR